MRQALTFGLFFLCAYAAWMGGGVPPPVQWPMSLTAFVLCLLVCIMPADTRRGMCKKVWNDPVFRFGGGFLLLLLLQWANSGYATGALPSKWVPWSPVRSGAAEMLHWFFPALTMLLLVRHVLKRSDIKLLLHLMVWNSAALACIGILQELSGAGRVLGVWDPARADFFATFAYPNHAAAWFCLHAALAAGLAHDAEVKRKPRIRTVVWGFCFLCCVVAAFLTLSRMGAFIAFMQMAVVFTILLRWTRRCLRGPRALNAYLVLSALGLVAMALFFGAGGGDLAREISGKPMLGQRSVAGDLVDRVELVSVAMEATGDYPVFGCGGWGIDGLADQYIPEDQRRTWMVSGRANVHCDPVQFLSEFGVVGSLCMGVVVALLLHGMILPRGGTIYWWGIAGVGAVMVHSLIDLPFRCPAILIAWCCLLAAIPRIVHHSSSSSPP